MTLSSYFILAAGIDAAAGIGTMLVAGRREQVSWLAGVLASIALAFLSLSGFVVGYEIIWGKGAISGLAWGFIYSPSNLLLSQGAWIAFLLANWLQTVIRRSPIAKARRL